MKAYQKYLKLISITYLLCLANILLAADVPSLINYQGKLTDSLGAAAADGTYKLEFRIWDDASTGTLIWGEETVVFVLSGAFNVILGQGVSITGAETTDIKEAFNGSERYLGLTVTTNELTVDLDAAEIAEISPRQQFLSTGFAVQAQKAVNADNADSLGGVAATTYTQQDNVIKPSTGDASTSGIDFPTSEVGNDTAGIKYFHDTSSTDNNILKIEATGEAGDDIQIKAAGNVDIESTIEDVKLTAANDVNLTATNDVNLTAANGVNISASGTHLVLETPGSGDDDIRLISTDDIVISADDAVLITAGNSTKGISFYGSIRQGGTSNSDAPFMIKQFKTSGSVDTGVSTSTYGAAWVVSFNNDRGFSDITLYQSGGTWRLGAGDGGSTNSDFLVMFIRIEWVYWDATIPTSSNF